MAEDLRAKAVGGMKWVLLTTYVGQAVGAASNYALAWVLEPRDWALVGAAMVVITIVRSCGNFGVNYALVHWRGDIAEAAATGHTLMWGVSLAAFGLVLAVAPLTAAYFRTPGMPLVTAILALSLLLKPPSVVAEGTLRKDFRLARLFVIEVGSHLVSSALALVIAVLLPRGSRYWALVVGGLAWEGLRAGLSFWLTNVPLRLGFDRQVARDLLRYGKFLVGSSILIVLYLSVDRLVLGRVDMTALGLYVFASTWVSQLGLVPAQIFSGVALPLYARLQDDPERVRSAYCRVLSYTALVALPLLAGLMMVVPDAVRLALPAAYHDSIQTFQILCLYTIVRALDNPSGQLFTAIGKPRYDTALNAANLAALVPLMVWLAPAYGAAGAALALLFARALRLALTMAFCSRVLTCPLGRLADALMPATSAAAVMSGALWGAEALVPFAGGGLGWLRLGGLVALGGVVYVGVVYLSHRELFVEVLRLVRDAVVPGKKSDGREQAAAS